MKKFQNVVFGDPIYFGKAVEDPSKEQVAEAHEKVIKAVDELFEKHKSEFGVADRKVEIL